MVVNGEIETKRLRGFVWARKSPTNGRIEVATYTKGINVYTQRAGSLNAG